MEKGRITYHCDHFLLLLLGQLAFLMDGRTRVDVDQPQGLPSQDVTLRKPVAASFEAPPIVRPLAASRYY